MTRPDGGAPRVDGPDTWHRLSPGMMVVRPIELAPQLLPGLVGIVFAAQAAPVIALVVAIVLAPLVTVVPWLATTYQATDEHVRVRSGVVNRKVATARRDRIRSVETTASLVHRLLALEKVTIGTGGDKASSNVVLTAVDKRYASALRDHLMPTGVPSDPADTEAGALPGSAHPPVILARYESRWLRFAPFSLLGIAAAAAVFGFGAQLADELGLFDHAAEFGTGLWDQIDDIPLAVVIVVGIIVTIAVGALLSVTAYVLSYWDFTLSRHDDGTLRVRRGLFTTTSTTLDENRVRGVHLHEPLLMRPLRGARLHAIATGAQKHPLLLPPAPADVVGHVGRAVSGAGGDLSAPLVAHPRAARRRRITRAVVGALVLSTALIVAWTPGPLPLAVAIAGVVALLCAGAAVGELRYRNLGHRFTDRALVIAPPTTARHRNLLYPDGIIGWSVRATWFQRRQGLVTLVAAGAAGTEAYGIIDVDGADASALAARISPGLVEPFLRRPRTPNPRTPDPGTRDRET
ncbi:PH domain-containing protein [Gordonia pseudamarae]|uniref:PH domain-containing protein n=1 Tax=Gordonia pseudamarae TaxID=2831662 RepID=A0ABX6IK00_9ACTN|nr:MULTISPECIES: PH domain-containing protein [Gordonia]MBD0022746.1 PH domain-containing protein [Gordonia sp. (in: high G+C Gram-positive bacteria)]QHN27349.1 PH domain-containing protein [Gordonia pseudamarae]QHN36233.1 PH domain-containing protein [Gordonia pseudamarae]